MKVPREWPASPADDGMIPDLSPPPQARWYGYALYFLLLAAGVGLLAAPFFLACDIL